MMRLWVALAFVVALGIPLLSAPTSALAANCGFSLGFKALHDLIPTTVGACLVDEHHNSSNGDGLQETTGPTGAGGLLVWRKADNWTAYTDGYRTWVNGPLGLQERLNIERFPWEVGPGSVATPPPTPSPSLCPPMRTNQIGLGPNIIYSTKAYVTVGNGLYGNVMPYGGDQRIDFLIRDSNGSIVWSRFGITGLNYFIFDPTYSDQFEIQAINNSFTESKTVILNWRVCGVP
jgi:hypothetical protein